MALANHPEKPVKTEQDFARMRERLKRCLIRENLFAFQGRTKSAEEKRSGAIAQALSHGGSRAFFTSNEQYITLAMWAWREHSEHLEHQRLCRQQLSFACATRFDELCIEYSRELRRLVCRETIVKIRPREIRDRIYEYLTPSETLPLLHFDPNMTGNLNQGARACDWAKFHPLTSYDIIWKADLDHVWRCEEVGHVVLTELVQTWYRVNTFLITDFSLVSDLVITDRWQLEIVPRDHIAHVQLSFSQGDLVVDERHRVRDIRVNLARLKQFDLHTHITININSKRCSCENEKAMSVRKSLDHHCAIWERDTMEICLFVQDIESAVFDILGELKDAGYPLVFIIDDLFQILATHEDLIDYDTWARLLDKGLKLSKREQERPYSCDTETN